jgi:hypothetical protein
VEVVDKQGRRCPLDNRTVRFSLSGEGEWRGGIAQGKDNYVLSDTLAVECGVNRVMLRSTTKAGEVTLKASAEGLRSQIISLHTNSVKVVKGLSTNMPSDGLSSVLDRGETPSTPSFVPSAIDIPIKSVEAGSNMDSASNSFDKNERSEWGSDGNLSNAWITYTLEKSAPIDNICIKLSSFRSKSYPIEIYAGDQKVWSGFTNKSLGYIHIPMKGVVNNKFTIRMVGESTDKDAFGAVTELDKANNERKNSGKNILRIIETEFISKIK